LPISRAQWDNTPYMQKPLTIVFQLLAAGMMLLGNAPAQQTPAATPAQPTQPVTTAAPAKSAPAAKSATTAKKAPTAAKTATPFTLKTQKDKESYALGMSYGKMLQQRGVPVGALDATAVVRGLKDAIAGGKLLLTDDEMRAALTQLQNEMLDAAHKEGEAFLAANKSKAGVVTLPSGLQYKILTEGKGPKPTTNDTVSCNYRGTLVNGKEFDSSYKRGEPVSFPVTGVIGGWTEALQLMPVGSKWQLFIPAGLAYGDKGKGDIAPGKTLIFEVELLSIGEQKK
jgi:FKBP-type peptidyl-prolyl cis-trans isomerase FklB